MPVLAAVVAAAAMASSYAPCVTGPAGTTSPIGDHDACVEAANRGMWQVDSGECTDPDQAGAYCYSHRWKWVGVPDQCHLQYMTPAEVKGVLGGECVCVCVYVLCTFCGTLCAFFGVWCFFWGFL